MSTFMRNTDAFTWAMESDPRLRSTVVTVLLLDRSPDWTELTDRIDRITRTLPMFRQCVVPSPPPAPPRWEDAEDFDLDFHLRRVAAPAPGTLDTVLEMARVAAMDDFDRARPLWHVTLIEGLRDDSAALLCKFHHSLSDGIGGVQIGMTLFDVTETPEQRAPLPAPAEPAARPWFGGYRDVIGHQAGLVASAVAGAITDGPKMLARSLLHPVSAIEAATATTASVYRTVRPINRPGSPLMRKRSLVRRLGVHAVPLPALREAAHRCDAALNDAFLAGLAGGLRRYHELHGVSVGDLHLTMPISLRAEDDAMGGNRITLMRFDVPVGVADPAQRIRAIREQTGRVRHERSLPYTEWIAAVLNLVPRWYIGSILRHVDFLASDVPGVPVPVFLGGARVLMQYAFGPTIGAAVNVTLLTYVDTCALGIDVDTGAIPDYDVFYDSLVAGFDEVLALAE
ncbi:wax ester/triacylglycerol synthase domain-containing protein [Mycolicibacterium sp. 050158]|uniref:wax ester/triacylglycerol synthase domain-containing protein n=1 Tax=Mycolicibacterium sp. 050158 TaxID=3090602 RepID=UPI00299D7CE7|nr:wax ester/triacylglycerol synthase domain-containing protein [Mycolicibacterium sp. 050158]MDX1890756.1 wax ester/triacylglycerol synthase family O-acyltransferase [Mycolicibacterium sp. 050158]